MRKLILAMFLTLDGHVAGPGGEFVPPDWSGDMQRHWSDPNADMAGLLVYGRRNFQFNAGFWQGAETDPAAPAEQRAFAARMNAFPKIVVSDTLGGQPGWNARTVRGADLAAEIGRLKQQDGKDLVSFGGAGIAQSLMRLGLVDEYRLLILPRLLGKGLPLFQPGHAAQRLSLTDTEVLDTGAVLLRYRAAA